MMYRKASLLRKLWSQLGPVSISVAYSLTHQFRCAGSQTERGRLHRDRAQGTGPDRSCGRCAKKRAAVSVRRTCTNSVEGPRRSCRTTCRATRRNAEAERMAGYARASGKSLVCCCVAVLPRAVARPLVCGLVVPVLAGWLLKYPLLLLVLLHQRAGMGGGRRGWLAPLFWC